MARRELILSGFHKLQLPPPPLLPHLWRTLPPLTKTHSELTSIPPPYRTQNRCKFKKKSPSWTESEFKCPELVRPGHLSKIGEREGCIKNWLRRREELFLACCWQVFTRNFTLFFVNQFSTLHAGYRGEGGARKFFLDFYHKTQLLLH